MVVNGNKTNTKSERETLCWNPLHTIAKTEIIHVACEEARNNLCRVLLQALERNAKRIDRAQERWRGSDGSLGASALVCVTVVVTRKTNWGQNCCRNKRVWRGGKRLYVTSFPLRSCFEQVRWVFFEVARKLFSGISNMGAHRQKAGRRDSDGCKGPPESAKFLSCVAGLVCVVTMGCHSCTKSRKRRWLEVGDRKPRGPRRFSQWKSCPIEDLDSHSRFDLYRCPGGTREIFSPTVKSANKDWGFTSVVHQPHSHKET